MSSKQELQSDTSWLSIRGLIIGHEPLRLWFFSDILTFENDTTSLPRKVGLQLPTDAKARPILTDTSSTLLQKPKPRMVIIIWSPQ
jgi:hypothetical protein